jgi:hypothetical protein
MEGFRQLQSGWIDMPRRCWQLSYCVEPGRKWQVARSQLDTVAYHELSACSRALQFSEKSTLADACLTANEEDLGRMFPGSFDTRSENIEFRFTSNEWW